MSENRQLNDALKNFAMPDYDQIPDVGLYLDQVARFINSFLGDFPEMQVTPSMISNYAKQKLIDRVNKKTYTRDQIAALQDHVGIRSNLTLAVSGYNTGSLKFK